MWRTARCRRSANGRETLQPVEIEEEQSTLHVSATGIFRSQSLHRFCSTEGKRMRDLHELTNSTPSYAPFGLKDMPSGTHPWVDANEAPQLARILDAVPQLVWTASVDGRLLYCNSEVRRRLGPCEGLAVEHIIPMKLVAPGDRGRWLGTWRRALEYGQSYEMEYTALTQQDSRARWYLERGTRIDADGASDRWFVTATRIDEQKRREEELVGMLLRKERFLVTLLHELRNPLAPIANATELLEKHSADPGAVISARGVIGRQLQQLTRLVDDLLDVSRIARGGVTLHRAPTDLREIIAVAIETAQPLIEERRHRLAAGTPAEAVMVNGDRARLCQVFSNLLINAAKYTNPGGRIDVALETRLGVAIGRIRDNGIGIAPDQLPRIFDLFSQGPPAGATAPGGLGVGLAVARQLVQLHAGSISAHSDGTGCGSEFVVRLPALIESSE